jgi:hypothetical protein
LDVDRIALLRGASTRRHTLIISDNPRDTRKNRAAPSYTQWLQSLPLGLQAEIGLLVQRLAIVTANTVARGAERMLVSSQQWPNVPGCVVTLEEAIRAVTLPTYVLVENAVNDAAFLRRIMPPVWAQKLDRWERQGMLRFEHAGGISQMKQILEHFTNDENSKRAFGLPSRLWRLVHVLVYDNDNDHKNTRDLDKACVVHSMKSRAHRLKRTKQEHYLPREALEAVVETKFKPGSGDATTKLAAINTHFARGEQRHSAALPSPDTFKNAFSKYETEIVWNDGWFAKDGAWPEMTLLAEMIAAAI